MIYAPQVGDKLVWLHEIELKVDRGHFAKFSRQRDPIEQFVIFHKKNLTTPLFSAVLTRGIEFETLTKIYVVSW